jgi:hypothetical protein
MFRTAMLLCGVAFLAAFMPQVTALSTTEAASQAVECLSWPKSVVAKARTFDSEEEPDDGAKNLQLQNVRFVIVQANRTCEVLPARPGQNLPFMSNNQPAFLRADEDGELYVLEYIGEATTGGTVFSGGLYVGPLRKQKLAPIPRI